MEGRIFNVLKIWQVQNLWLQTRARTPPNQFGAPIAAAAGKPAISLPRQMLDLNFSASARVSAVSRFASKFWNF